MFFRSWAFAVTAFLLLYPQPAGSSSPISIQYSLVPLGGNSYRYVYSITNNGSLPGGAPIVNFEIAFDSSLYSTTCTPSLPTCIVTSQVNNSLTSQWSQIWLSAVPPIPPLYDALAIGSNTGIPSGTTVTGFAVNFTWLGSGVPGPQAFQIFDSSFNLLQTGQTVAAAVPSTVPASSTLSLSLLGAGLSLAAAYHVRAQNRRTRPQTETAARS